MTYKADDYCTCNHTPDEHLADGTGWCTASITFARTTPQPCTCRRFRSHRQAREQRRDDAFWRRVGR